MNAGTPTSAATSRVLAFLLCGRHAQGGSVVDDDIYVAMNMHWEEHVFGLPQPPDGLRWHVFSNTGAASPDDIWTPGEEPVVADETHFVLGPRAVAVFVSHPTGWNQGETWASAQPRR